MTLVRTVTASVCRQEACPLYAEGAEIEFVGTRVSGTDDITSVCWVAVANFQKAVGKIQGGKAVDGFQNSFCGGCTGKAYFNFRMEEHAEDTAFRQKQDWIMDALSNVSIFEGASEAALSRLVPILEEKVFQEGEDLIVKGTTGDGFYVIADGIVEIIQADDYAVENILNELGPGDCLGEMSLITGDTTSATVRAKSLVRTLRVNEDNFKRLLNLIPSMNFALAKILAKRLAKAGTWVIEELGKGVIGRLEMISPGELVQAMNVNAQTGLLVVTNDVDRLKTNIYLQDGQISHVKDIDGGLEGEEAFYRFLSWTSGTFRMEQDAEQPARNVVTDTIGMLLEGMRRMDEGQQ